MRPWPNLFSFVRKFESTHQSPLPVLRPLGNPSLLTLPAAAEAKLDVNGEGMFVRDSVFFENVVEEARQRYGKFEGAQVEVDDNLLALAP